jgi:hypothetical protein
MRLPLRPTAPITHEGLQRACEIRACMLAGGYHPLSISTPANPYVEPQVAGKKPCVEYVDGVRRPWSEGHSLERLMQVTPMSSNTGVLLGGEHHLIALDIDPAKTADMVTRTAFARSIVEIVCGGPLAERLILDALGRTRDGASIALLARADQEIHKQQVSGECGLVEILAHGQQIVVDGLHPASTVDNPMRWSWTNDRAPWTVAVDDLPVIAAVEIERLLAAISGAGVLGPPVARAGRGVTRRGDGTRTRGARGEPYPATLRLRQLLQANEGRVKPAVRALVDEVGGAGTGRHDCLVAICGRLVALRWDAARAIDFLIPLMNQHFLDGDWTTEVERAIEHARRRNLENLCKCGSTTWTRR